MRHGHTPMKKKCELQRCRLLLKLVDTAAAKYQRKRQVCGEGTITQKVRGKVVAHGYGSRAQRQAYQGTRGFTLLSRPLFFSYTVCTCERSSRQQERETSVTGKQAGNYKQGGILRVTPLV